MSRSFFVSLVFAFLLNTGLNADLVDMSSVSWSAGDTSHTATSAGGVNVDFNFSGTLTTSPQPAGSPNEGTATPYIQSGVSGFDDGLVWRFDDAETNGGPGVTTTDVISLEIAFQGPAVTNVSMVLGDIDTGSNAASPGVSFANWQDVVVVRGLDSGGATVAATETLLGGGSTSVIRNDGNLYDPVGDNAVTLAGIDGPTGAADTRGNVQIDFASAIAKILIDYRPGQMADFILGSGPDDTTSQFISLHDINFTAVPEPSSFALIGLVGLGIGVRRRKSILEFIKSLWS